MKYCIVLEKGNYLIKNKQGKIISSTQSLAQAKAQVGRLTQKQGVSNEKTHNNTHNTSTKS